jgi:ATP-binding cassette, subfamily C, bacterial CydCD
MDSPDRRPPALVRSGGPLGALPALSGAARRALAGIAALSALTAVSVVTQALALAQVVAAIVGGRSWSPEWLGVLAGAVVVRALVTWATQVVAARAAAGTKAELRASLVDSAVRRGPEWIAARGPAELTALGTRGLDALDAYFAQYLPALVSAVVLPVAVGFAILLADPLSAVLVAVTVPLIPVFAILVGKYTQGRVGALADAEERLSGRLLELIKALPVLIAFRRADAQVTAVRTVSEKHRAATMATLRVAFSSAVVLELVSTLSVALVAVGIGLRLVGGDLGLATGLFVLVLAPECYLPLRAAGAAHHASEDGVEAVRRVADVLVDAPDGGHPMPRGEVKLTGLRVARRDMIPVTCTVRPGEITRLDLPSGAGKSTAIAALLGFASPCDGRITVADVELTDADLVAWRRSIAWVPQRPAFTGATVADELELAVPEALTSEIAELSVALGINALLGRGTAELSTGERQRVAVARALLRVRHGAWLLVLDEPTAHLDPRHAAAVQAQVRQAADAGVAVLLASHRATAAGEGPARTGSSSADVRSAREPGRARLRALISGRLLMAALLGTLALAAGVALTATSAWLIATASERPSILTLSVAIVGVRAFGLAKAGLRYAERLTSHDAALRTATTLRERLWRKVIHLGAAAPQPAEAARRLVDDVTTVRDLTPRVLMPPLIAAGVSLLAIAVQWTVLPAAGLALLAAVLVAGLIAPWLTVRLDNRSTAARTGDRRVVAARMLTLFDAAPDLLAYGADKSVRAELAALDADLTRRARRQAFGAGAGAGLVVLATGLAALTGAWLGTGSGVLVAVLALVPLALTEALAPLPAAAQHLSALRTALTSITLPNRDERPAFEAVSAPGAVVESPAPLRDEQPRPALAMTAASGSRRTSGAVVGVAGRLSVVDRSAEQLPCTTPPPVVELVGVDVRWPGAGQPALRDLTITIPKGAHVAVVGESGAGKSTLLALLLGFLDPERGTAHRPERVAWCPQEPHLVATTVRENLRLADPAATDAELADALRAACLPTWADRLDVELGAGGSGTSGGEATRIALARALLTRDADLVLLDEPTAHLDVPTARKLLAGLKERLAGRTVLHVTHRPEEAADADLVLDLSRRT